MKKIRAAALQFSVRPMQVDFNLDKAYSWIRKLSSQHNPDLIVLPESFTTGFTPSCSLKELWEAVDTIPGKLTDIAVDWAKELDTIICFPTYERGPSSDVVYNSAALASPEGLLGAYRKTHPFPTERLEGGGWTTPGQKTFCVETPLGSIGIVICYDGDFPELARATALKGAEVICRPSAFLRTYEQWELTNRARAYDNHVYWVATNAVGPDCNGASFFGSSMIVHPSGAILSLAGGCDEFIVKDLDPDPIKSIYPGSSRPQIFDHVEDRNLKSYNGILSPGKSRFEPSKRIPYKR